MGNQARRARLMARFGDADGGRHKHTFEPPVPKAISAIQQLIYGRERRRRNRRAGFVADSVADGGDNDPALISRRRYTRPNERPSLPPRQTTIVVSCQGIGREIGRRFARPCKCVRSDTSMRTSAKRKTRFACAVDSTCPVLTHVALHVCSRPASRPCHPEELCRDTE